MSKLGELLSTTREQGGVTYDRITQDTRISEDILKMLEEGKYCDMPSYIHAHNFVRTYAKYLGIDAEIVDDLFHAECCRDDFSRGFSCVTSPVTQEEVPRRSSLRIVIPLIVVLILGITGAYLYISIVKNGDSEVQSSQQAPVGSNAGGPVEEDAEPEPKPESGESAVMADNESASEGTELADEQVQATETVEEAEPVVEETAEAEPEDTVQETPPEAPEALDDEEKAALSGNKVVLRFADTCWVHMDVDGAEEYDFIAEKNSDRVVTFNEYFVMDVGNASVVTVSHKSRDIRGLGGFRKPAKDLRFTVNDEGKLVYEKLN
ncbi:helix-turn-helix domain-containing protein [Limisalsivibrio acetivorans]|uniref:helix-turn-helix domain-containing protein n=1 Tax=Limisalsivibrio acetivorans TaxID=1304888 RepID=UPI0003B7487B|nr:RodZ domain-containing protein [Limisalsivibrio acetivorans]